jgi:hypothetical protein
MRVYRVLPYQQADTLLPIGQSFESEAAMAAAFPRQGLTSD